MVGVKEICALLLAGGIGAGSVVTVQQAVPAAKKVTRPQAAKPASAPRRPAAEAARPSGLYDCSSTLGILGKDMALPPLSPIEVAPGLPIGQTAMGGAPGGGAPGGGGFINPGPNPGGGGNGGGGVAVVPEAGTWAMLIAGFGLVGLAMRRGRPQDGDEQGA